MSANLTSQALKSILIIIVLNRFVCCVIRVDIQDVLQSRDNVTLLSEHNTPALNLTYEMSLHCQTSKSTLLCYFNLSDLSISGLRQR